MQARLGVFSGSVAAFAVAGACGGAVMAGGDGASADFGTPPSPYDAAAALEAAGRMDGSSSTPTGVGLSSGLNNPSDGSNLMFSFPTVRDSGGDATSDGGATDACAPFLPTIDAAPERAAPDAPAPLSCDFAPSDLACNTTADCVIVELIECRCWEPAIGANKNNTYNCPPPPCVPFGPCGADSGVVAQDCKLAPGGTGLSVACVDGRCSTYVAAADADTTE